MRMILAFGYFKRNSPQNSTPTKPAPTIKLVSITTIERINVSVDGGRPAPLKTTVLAWKPRRPRQWRTLRSECMG
eukprot:1852889-Rhodomonas_salina.3